MAANFRRRPVFSQKSSNKFLFWDVDTTGRRVIDEICQVAAFSPKMSFRQYIMPYRDLDIRSQRRHQINTVTVWIYRVLKETRHGRILKTKSEMYALLDFLMWLETFKSNNGRIILISFEEYKLAPYLLVEGLKRYNLLPRFAGLVAGFANAYPYVKAKCESSMSSFSLRTLAKVLLNKDQEEIFSAHNRAKLSYEIVEHLCAGEIEDEMHPVLKAVMPSFTTIDTEEIGIQEIKLAFEKQNTLRPIFLPLLKNPRTRKRALVLRSYLTDNNIYFEELKFIWNEHKETEKLDGFLSEKIHFNEVADKLELMKTIDDYFQSVRENNDSEAGNFNRGQNKKHFRRSKRFNNRANKTPLVPDPASNNDAEGN